MANILFVRLASELPSPFIDTDLALIRQRHAVKTLDVQVTNLGNGGTAPNKVALVRELAAGLKWADLAYIWAADLHALGTLALAKIYGVKTVVAIAGYEADPVPRFGYGYPLHPGKRRMVQAILNHADQILVPSPYLAQEVRRSFGPTNAPIAVVPLGFDPAQFTPRGEKADQVLSVALVQTTDRAALKGIETLVAAAPQIDCDIILAGLGPRVIEALQSRPTENLSLFGPLPQETLIGLYQASTVYAQCAYTETFGACVAEAMLCGCAPVVREVGNLPLLVGDAGISFAEDPVAAIQAARDHPELGERARARIASVYPLSARADRIAAILEDLI